MARVLMGWELGGGLGHIGALVPIAKELAAHGHQPLFVVKNLPGSLPMTRGTGFPILQAPVWPANTGGVGEGRFKANTFADILAIRGFLDAEELRHQVEAWQQLLDLTGAQLVVSDYSPTLNLAASGAVPLVLVGNGFTLPPSELPWYPALDPNLRPLVPQERLLANVQKVQRDRGRQVPARLPELFAAQGRFIYTFPELDPYRQGRRANIAVGPYHGFPQRVAPPDRPLVFVYLSAEFPGAGKVLAALAEAGCGGNAYFRDCGPEFSEKLQGLGFDVHAQPPSVEKMLPAAAVVVHHAGAGLAASALAAGRPQVNLPRYLEQELTGQTLEELGVGINLAGHVALDRFVGAVRRLLNEPRFSHRAMDLAGDLERRGPWNGLPKIVARCLELLA